MKIDPDLIALGECDERGVPLVGRQRELELLRMAGSRDLAFGRIFEGHVNALQLIARCGSEAQRRRAAALSRGDRLRFGVWNTEDAGGVKIEPSDGGYFLSGAKTWCSGAGMLTHPLLTARRPDGASQMCLIPMERVTATIDRGGWEPLGMERSDSFRVGFDGVAIGDEDLIGAPGDYEAAPWFLAGAIRFVAVQAGGIARLVHETALYLLDLKRDGDPFQAARVARMQIASRSSSNWLDLAAREWQAFDADPSDANAARVTGVADMARAAVERDALEAIADAERCVGARGLLEPLPFSKLVRDLQMYLRQPAPDAAIVRVGRSAFEAAIVRVGRSAFEAAIADRNACKATATGTS